MLVRDSTNWGKNKVKIYAQGSDVLTAHNAKGVKRLDHLHIPDHSLYDSMGYTSAASAIVAGIVGLLQAYARSEHKPKSRALTPTEMKGILEASKGAPVTKNGEVVGYSIDVEEAKKRIDALFAGG